MTSDETPADVIEQRAAQAITASIGPDGKWADCTPLHFARALHAAGLLHTAQDDLDLWDAKRIKAERDELREKVEELRLIANVNGDWNVKYAQLRRERDELRATVDRVRALADRWNTEWLESVRPEHRSKVRPAWAARGIWRALDGDEGEQR